MVKKPIYLHPFKHEDNHILVRLFLNMYLSDGHLTSRFRIFKLKKKRFMDLEKDCNDLGREVRNLECSLNLYF